MENHKQQLLEEEISRLEKDGKLHDLSIADLVMMQMAGDFNKFLGRFTSKSACDDKSFEDAVKMI